MFQQIENQHKNHTVTFHVLNSFWNRFSLHVILSNKEIEWPVHDFFKRKGKFSSSISCLLAIYCSTKQDPTITTNRSNSHFHIYPHQHLRTQGLVYAQVNIPTLACHTLLKGTTEAGSDKLARTGKHPEGRDIIYLADAPSLAQLSKDPLGSSAYPGRHAIKLDKLSCEEVETEAGN